MLPLSSNDHSRFPKLKECAHFHYDFVDLGSVQLSLDDVHHDSHDSSFGSTSTNSIMVQSENGRERSWRLSDSAANNRYYIRVCSRDKAWVVRQSYEGFCNFDRQLHRCIYDRKYSLLPELEGNDMSAKSQQELRKLFSIYLKRFSAIACNMINCGSVLTWMEMDNRGNHLVAPDNGAINVPAVAAGHVVKRYVAQSLDELSLEVSDIVSIIDMPPANETSWWQGKCKFEVGFFPSECVQVISGIVPESMTTKLPPKPVLRKRGKLISFLRSFFFSRPTRSQLKQTGIVKERVFGCDLGEHLQNSGHEVPLVLQVCTQAIEVHGVVDGIYRLSGVASNIQKLRNTFDEDRVPELTEDLFVQDVHCISSLLKMYFRELPNPLFTYQLYDKFALAMEDEEMRLSNIYDVVRQLPPPHYRTASYLMRHLCRMASHNSKTNMHCKNLAIVWAPNLFRSKELEQIQCSTAALSGVGIQAIITEYLIMYADIIFSDGAGNSGVSTIRHRPKSLMPLPSKLLSLEEAQERALLKSPRQKYIDVGGGPLALPHDYHTVVDLPKGKKPRKERKPSLSGLKAIFSRSRSGSYHSNYSDRFSVCDPHLQVRCNPLVKPSNSALRPDAADLRRRIRMAKSVDMLCSVGRIEPEHFKRRTAYDGGNIIANPYAEEHWLSVSQAALNKGSGRPRTKSCNSSLSDSSDLEDHCSTFIKPLQSSPQNSLKRRVRYSDVPSSLTTASFSQKPFESFGRTHGKENCDVYRNIAHSATSQPRISLASRFNIPPAIPKRSTSLYINSFDNETPHCHSDAFLSGSKSLATVDSCRTNTAVLHLPLPPCSHSPHYSSSPSQSDHSDEVFNCGSAPCESDHPLTPICEMQNVGSIEACHRSWDASSSCDTPARFSMWLDGLYRKSPGRVSADQMVASAQSIDDTYVNLKDLSRSQNPDAGSVRGSEDVINERFLLRDDLVERWEVPTLVSGSAFVTDVDEFLNYQSQTLPSVSSSSKEELDLVSPFSDFSSHLPEPSNNELQSEFCNVDFIKKHSLSTAEVFESPVHFAQSSSTPTCLMEYSDDSDYDNEVTPTEEQFHFLHNKKGIVFDATTEDNVSDNEIDKSTSAFDEGTDTVQCSRDLSPVGNLEKGLEDVEDLQISFSIQDDVDLITEIDQHMELHMEFQEKDDIATECLEDGQKISMIKSDCVQVKSSLPETQGKMDYSFSVEAAGESSDKLSDVLLHSIIGHGDQIAMELMNSVQKKEVFVTDSGGSCDSDHIAESETWYSDGHLVGLSSFQEDGNFENSVTASDDVNIDDLTIEPAAVVAAFNQNSSVTVSTDAHVQEPNESTQTVSHLNFFIPDEDSNNEDCRSDAPDYINSFPLVTTSVAVEKSSSYQPFETSKEDRCHSWVCIAMTGIPAPGQPRENSMETSPNSKFTENESDSKCLGLRPSLQTQAVTEKKDDNTSEDADPNQISWKSSLSLTTCLLQLCADGYVADHSNSSSPVMADNSVWSSHSKTVLHEMPNVIFSSSSISSKAEGLFDIHDNAVLSEPKCIMDPLQSSLVSERLSAVDKEPAVMKYESAESCNWSSDNQPVCASSESDVCSSASEQHQFNSPVRRKSVRELKNKFESVAGDSGPVRPTVKKRPPVAKKPSGVRSSALVRSATKCNSYDVLSDSSSGKGLVLVTTNTSDLAEMPWSQGCVTAPVITDNKFSFADCSSVKSSSSLVDNPAKRPVESRPSSAGSFVSEENLVKSSHKCESSEGYRSAPESDKRLKHSKYGTCINDEVGLSVVSQAQFHDQYFDECSVSGLLLSSSRCPVYDGLLSLENSETASVSFKSVQNLENYQKERCFATVAFPDNKSIASGVKCTQSTDPIVLANEDKNLDVEETTYRNQTFSHDIVNSNDRGSAGDHESSCHHPVIKSFGHISSVNEANASSCESLSFLGMESFSTDVITASTILDSSTNTSACETDLSPAPPCHASSLDVAKKPNVGRVRGLSAMFEQQSLERAENAQGRRESLQGHRMPDISGRNSQVWKGYVPSSGEGEVANQALRNLTIKL